MNNKSTTLRLRQMTTIATTTLCLICCIPQQGFCALPSINQIASDLNYFTQRHLNISDLAASLCICPLFEDSPCLGKSLNDLAKSIDNSHERLAITKEFFQAYLGQFNVEHNTRLTMEDALGSLQDNIDIIPEEYRETVKAAIEATITSNTSDTCGKLYWPWDWNWFGLNKDNKHHRHNVNFGALACKISEPTALIIIILASIAAITIVALYCPQALPAVSAAIVEVTTSVLRH